MSKPTSSSFANPRFTVLGFAWLIVAAAACGNVALSPDGGGKGEAAAGTGAPSSGTAGTGAAGSDPAGTGGAGTGAAGSGTGGTGAAGSGAAGTGAAGTGGGACAGIRCTVGRTCCGGGCANVNNDPMNCGMCGKRCEGPTNLCSGGKCVAPTCSPNVELCAPNSFCCGSACCAPGDLCCEHDGPVSGGPPSCFTPTKDQPTCPQGCAPLCVSDRNQKKNITPVDGAAVLERVARLPISTWTYRTEPDGVRHLGPMAQDFRASFGLGDDDRTYFAVDAQGVALAAIQELHRVVVEQQKRIEGLERENARLARRQKVSR
jgi:hypothetical protein